SFTVAKLAGMVRKALGDDTSDSAVRFAMEAVTATSLEAVQEYAKGMEAISNGKFEDGLLRFSKAVDIDQHFGLAYEAMAVAYSNLRRHQDAEKYINLALKYIDRMTEREKYRTLGAYYFLVGDRRKCVEEYTHLINRFPFDAGAHNNLAV